MAREYIIAGNWKLNNGGAKGLALAAELRDAVKGVDEGQGRRRSAIHGARRDRLRARRKQRRSLGAEPLPEGQRSVHRRGERSHAARGGVSLGHPRSQRAPSVLRRDGRVGEGEGRRRNRSRPSTYRVHRRDPRRARSGQNARGRVPPARRVLGRVREEARLRRHRLRARGRSGPARWPPSNRRRRSTRPSAST